MRALLRLGLAILSLVVSLAALEIVLRYRLAVEDLYARLETFPELASAGWRRAFLRDYGALRAHGAVGPGLGGLVHDPVLGWDVPGRIRTSREMSPVVPAVLRRVLFLGDSFAYGAEVEVEESFPAQLETTLPDTEVLNMGVIAYGVDQAALKYWLHGRRYAPDVVVFAIFGPDYYRTPLSFYRFAKPRFVVAPDGRNVTLAEAPLAAPDAVYRALERDTWPLSFAWAFFRQELLASEAWERVMHAEELYFYRHDELHEALLRRTAEVACEDGASLFFVYVPSRHEVVPLRPPVRERRHLRRIFARLGVPLVDLTDEILQRYGADDAQQLYLMQDGRAGHFTPWGNRAVAEILRDRIFAAQPSSARQNAASPSSQGGSTMRGSCSVSSTE
jgi:hypothetical protein